MPQFILKIDLGSGADLGRQHLAWAIERVALKVKRGEMKGEIIDFLDHVVGHYEVVDS